MSFVIHILEGACAGSGGAVAPAFPGLCVPERAGQIPGLAPVYNLYANYRRQQLYPKAALSRSLTDFLAHAIHRVVSP